MTYVRVNSKFMFPLHNFRLIDNSIRYRLLGRVIAVPTLRDYLVQSALKNEPRLAAGHTVMLIAS